MKEIRDYKSRIACLADAATGKIEILYKKHKTIMTIPVGGIVRIEREDVVTIIERSEEKFLIERITKTV
ncbi:hypothetical protein [uncultured Acetobacterium sp.]|uniref:hypothetical protein n=1 Tax=uncultured Acetobacterium sp. TaxID=217139 RepID=UPI0025E48D68|nr:hypothetical protein [uncultured Acetobacterium sp.]